MATRTGYVQLDYVRMKGSRAVYCVKGKQCFVELPEFFVNRQPTAETFEPILHLELQVLDLSPGVGNIVNCPQCGARATYYDGALGYEATRCDSCHTETDLNNPANKSPWPPAAE